MIDTFAEDCYLETVPLDLRSEGRDAARAAYVGYFTAFPDLAPEDEGVAFGDNVMVVWGHLKGSSGGEWLGVPPSGGAFRVPFTNITTFVDGRMAGESIYFDLATLCDQAGLPVDAIRSAAQARHSRDRDSLNRQRASRRTRRRVQDGSKTAQLTDPDGIRGGLDDADAVPERARQPGPSRMA